MNFTTILLQAGKTATGFEVPDDVIAQLGAGKRPKVKVTVHGHTYRSTVAVMNGRHMIGVSADNRQAAGVAGGDTIEVDLQLDTEPRILDIPEDLQGALAADPTAEDTFTSLSYSRRQRIVLAVEAAKTSSTRQRRINNTIEQLRHGQT
jgi:uncharacterized protein YdeI (YjbR/CyaY-like superfamily)